MEEQVLNTEHTDGIRLTWNKLPIIPKDTTLPIPISVLYTPLNPSPIIPHEPLFCANSVCRSVFNPFCKIINNQWTCILCNTINNGVIPTSTTVDYILNKVVPEFMYVLVVDMCTFDKERHDLLVEGVRSTLESLPLYSKVGLILFGTNIELFEFSCSVKKVYLFSGKKEYLKEDLQNIICGGSVSKEVGGNLGNLNCFFTSPEKMAMNFIKRDPFPVLDGNRPVRCTGSAISLAVSLLSFCVNDTPAKIILFTQGPPTFGPGCLASLSLSDNIRSNNDILKGKADYYKKGIEYYNKLGHRMVGIGVSLDILAATLYDVGIEEMRGMTDMTGGCVVMAQDFDKEIYISSIKKLYSLHENETEDLHSPKYGFNARLKVLSSKNLVFKGVLGLGASQPSTHKINYLRSTTNLTLLFENGVVQAGEKGFIQLLMQYVRPDGRLILRVTSLLREFDDSHSKDVKESFDQEAAVVLISRMISGVEDDMDLIRRIDRGLIRFVKKFGSFIKGDLESVCLPDNMVYYPNFIYFLRRSLIVQRETSSPDENAYYRNLVMRERVNECMTMIVPTLISFHYQGEIKPVEMDSKSLKDDCILLLDTFHNVVLWRGESIASWIKEGYHLKEDFKYFKEILDEAETKAKSLVNERFPTPQFVVCDRYGSQERILLAKVNPSLKNSVVVTDDIDFETFYKHLCKIVVEI
ncbi:GTPase-activating protein S23 [Hamiltosporidium tvaerminnensis]|nr:GTPase-activating protein S23 [Hamiltosporidium tvaerminnensis]